MRKLNSSFLTPEEHYLMGGTPELEPEDSLDHNIPICLLKGIKSVDEVNVERERVGTFTGLLADRYAGVDSTNRWRPMLKLQPIDSVTKQTIEDPVIIALIHEETDEIRILSEEESGRLTTEFYKKYSELRVEALRKYGEVPDMHLREPWKSVADGQVSKSPENRG